MFILRERKWKNEFSLIIFKFNFLKSLSLSFSLECYVVIVIALLRETRELFSNIYIERIFIIP